MAEGKAMFSPKEGKYSEREKSWEATLENSNVRGVGGKTNKQPAKEARKKQEKEVRWDSRGKESQGSMKQQQ